VTTVCDSERGRLEPRSRPRALAAVALAAYLGLLLWLTLAALPTERPVPNVVPFRSIAVFCARGGSDFLVNIVGNLAAFVPLGLLVPMSRRRPTSALGMLLLGASLSAAIEAAQFASGNRVADADDVILNAAGTLAGYALFLAIRRGRPTHERAGEGASAAAADTMNE
jgi:glycopeptide antibiotics resistance protein